MVAALCSGRFAGIAGIVVVLARRSALQLTGSGDFELLRYVLLRLHLGHKVLSFKFIIDNRCLLGHDEDAESARPPSYVLLDLVGDGDRFYEGKEILFRFVAHRLLAAAEHQVDLHLVALEHEFLGLGFFEKEIVLFGSVAETDTLGLDLLLFRLGDLSLLCLLVLEFAVVGDTTDRRYGLRGNLDDIEAFFLGDDHRRRRRHGAEIFAFFRDDDNLRGEDLLVHAVTLFDNDFRFRAMVPSSSHEGNDKNLVELMGIAPMSSNGIPK